MNILDRYIGRNVIAATLLVLLILLGVQSFIIFVGELSNIGTLNYTLGRALLYVVMQLPTALYQYFPIAALVGVLMGLGRMASGSELIVMRASGVALIRIILAVLKTMILALIVVTAIGEWVAPMSANYSNAMKTTEMTGGQALRTMQGTWVRDNDNFIYIGQISPDNKLTDITRYRFNNYRLISASHADTAIYQNGHWIFNQVTESHIGNDVVTSQVSPQEVWPITFKPRLFNFVRVDPSELTLPHLFSYVHYLQQNQQNANQVEFQFWQRLLQPLATIIMFCLGVPFIFGPLRNTTMGFRIVAGACVGITFFMLNQFFGPLSMVYQFPPLLAASLPLILFALGGGILLWSVR